MRTNEKSLPHHGAPLPRFNFTKAAIDALPHPTAGQAYYRDTRVAGLGLRIGIKSRVFYVEGYIRGQTCRVTLGDAKLMPVEAARKKALAALAEIADGVNPNQAAHERLAERITVKEAFDAFFEAKTKLAACTVDGYSRTRDKYLADWQKKPIVEISRQMILSRHQKITSQHGAITANNAFRHFRSVFNFTAASFDEFPANPVTILTQARAWHRENRRRRVISVHELPKWWEAVLNETEDARDIFLIALFTGMRRSEIVRLEWEHIDLVAKTLHLPSTKNGDPLDLPLSDFLTSVIEQRREQAGQSPWLFPSHGETGHITETKSFVRRIVTATAIEFSTHDLRRTFITITDK